MASQAEVGRHLDLSQQAVSELLKAGVLPSGEGAAGLDIDECRIAYVRNLRERAAGRASDQAEAAGLDVVAERARLARAQADAQEMKNDVTRGELIPRADVVAGIQVAFAAARARLLGIPSKAAPLLIGVETPAAARDILTDLIHECCGELAATRAIPAAAREPDDGRGGDGGAADLGSSAPPDGQRVG